MNSHQRRTARRKAGPEYRGCGYWHGGTIECRGGPDGAPGYMWDADHDGFDPDDHSMPCPACNTLEWLREAKEEAEYTSYYCGYSSGTGETIWLNAVNVARAANPTAVEAALMEVGEVHALAKDDDAPEGYVVRIHNQLATTIDAEAPDPYAHSDGGTAMVQQAKE